MTELIYIDPAILELCVDVNAIKQSLADLLACFPAPDPNPVQLAVTDGDGCGCIRPCRLA